MHRARFITSTISPISAHPPPPLARTMRFIDHHSGRNRQRADKAARYLEQRNYESHQRNGQRVSIHRTLKTDENSYGPREVFIGKLPRDLFEDELLPKMEKAGRVRKMRLMMDFSGSNRGFAFAEYVSTKEAQHAVELLNRSVIRVGQPPIGVLMSFDNKRLMIGNLPLKIGERMLRTQLDKVITGVESIALKDCPPGENSRYALVTFETHEAATQARRVLCPGNITICNRVVTIEWAKPEQPGQQQQQQQLQLHQNRNRNQQPQPHRARSNINFRPPAAAAAVVVSAPPQLPLQLPAAPSILGERAIQMLANCPPDPQCTTIIENINLDLFDEYKLKAVLQFVDFMTITKMVECAPETLEVTYEIPEQARTLTRLFNQLPEFFNKLAVPGKQLKAYQVITPLMPDLNANYQLVPHHHI